MAKKETEIIVEAAPTVELPTPDDPAIQMIQTTLDKFLDTARVERVYGQPVQHGDTLILPSAEVLTGVGFGAGYGSGPQSEQESTGGGGGGGGGGRTFARPVAVIIASPEGVRVEPVVDVTKIGLAALTAGLFMFGMLARLRRPARLLKELRDADVV